MTEQIIESSGNVFADLGFPTEAAELLALRASLMNELRKTVAVAGWTPAEAAIRLSINQTQVSKLMSGKHEEFTLDMLIILAVRLGKRCELRLVAYG